MEGRSAGDRRRRGRRVAGLAGACLLACLAGACAADLSRAQDAFEKAARADAQLHIRAERHFDDYGSEVLAPLAARRYYLSALEELEGAIPRDETSPRAQELGSIQGALRRRDALTLESLCLWQLGYHDQALQSAQDAGDILDADELIDDQHLSRRDAAIFRAIPGLIQLDRAHAVGSTLADVKQPEGRLEHARRVLLDGKLAAVDAFRRARDELAWDEPFQSYHIQAQLAAHRDYLALSRSAHDELHYRGEPVGPLEDWRARHEEGIETAVQYLLDELDGVLPNTLEGRSLWDQWRVTFAGYFSLASASSMKK